jgi:alkaline phosphatase D
LLGAEQESWLAEGLRRSVRGGTKWQLLGQQVIMGSTRLPPEAAGWMAPDVDMRVRRVVEAGLVASRAGLPLNFDAWDGFPAARDRLLRSSLDADANLIVLSGDSHNAWAFNLDLDGTPAGVEFAGHSVTSSGYEAFLPRVRPDDIVRALVDRNPQLAWAETSRRGYLTLELTPERATGEWSSRHDPRARPVCPASPDERGAGTNRLG